MSATSERLYGLLPQVVQLRDAEAGGALRELIGILATRAEVIDADLDHFYSDQFIETCADWVVPYIGDLVGYRMVHGRAPGAPSARAEVANTIAYRRRKGTASMIEQLARDVTDWPARAVEFFERLAATQYLGHVRPHAVATADFRRRETLDEIARLAGAFDDVSHTVDVRRIDAPLPHGRGRHNIPNLGIFLFRTMPMPLRRSVLRPHSGDGQRYRFDPLGTDTQLFSNPVPETEITHLATPANVPLPLTVRRLADHLSEYYAADRGMLVEVSSGGVVTAVPVDDVRACDLRDSGAGWAHMPPPGTVAIDPERGRIAFGAPLGPSEVPLGTFHLGMAVPVGARTILRTHVADGPGHLGLPEPPEPAVWASGGGDLQPHLDTVKDGGTVRLLDSSWWTPGPTVVVTPAPAGEPPRAVAVVGEPGARPVVHALSGVRLDLAPGSHVLLDGLVMNGGPVYLDEAGDDQPRTVALKDCTLVPGLTRTPEGAPAQPGAASLIVLDPFATVILDGCITGPIVVVEGANLVVNSSVIDAGDATAVAIAGREPGAAHRTVSTAADLLTGDGMAEAGDVSIASSTIIGGIHAVRLDATDAILLAALASGDPRTAAVWTQRRQVGCVRFSWLPPDSRTGRRFHCLPDRADPLQVQQRMLPAFTSLRFGHPAYAQLTASTPAPIRRGAQDESEMGATHDLYAPQREDDLAVRLQEYLRFGLEAGIFHAT